MRKCSPNKILDSQHGIQNAFQQVEEECRATLTKKVRQLSDLEFEHFVGELLCAIEKAHSYEVTPRSNDSGIDGFVYLDPLGVKRIYYQAKRWNQPVGRPEVQKFVGAVAGLPHESGVLATSDTFTKQARAFAQTVKPQLILLDIVRIVDLCYQYNFGIQVIQSYTVKELAPDTHWKFPRFTPNRLNS